MRKRILLLIQLFATAAILAWLPTNIGKTAAFLTLWLLTFQSLDRKELAFFACACALFSAMDIASLRQGIFAFDHPDVLGLPYYEYFMWGFYLLHTLRIINAPPARSRTAWAYVLAALFALCFATITDQNALFIATGIVLALGLALFHDKFDIAHITYMIFLGALIEVTGVWTGQWHYPGAPTGGVPPWFLTLWGGTGLFLRRLIPPLLSTSDHRTRPATS